MSDNLFLNGIFSSDKKTPNKVQIYIPEWYSGTGRSVTSNVPSLVGLLASEFTFTSQNKWGPILSDVSNLSDLSALMGDNEIFSWIGASVQCWKGTEPLKFSLDFYLINYTPNLGLERTLSSLVKLTSLAKAEGALDQNVKVVAHGGYKPNVLSPNKSVFDNSGWGGLSKEKINETQGSITSLGQDLFSGSGLETGTVKVEIGSRITISNILVSRVDTTPSVVEVADQNGNNPKPLYYRVSASFIGTKPLLATEVDSIYGNI